MKNELVLVTGAGSGIGAAVARRLGNDGYRVAATDLDEGAARRVAEEIGAEGGEAHAGVLDVTDRSSIEAALDAATERVGTLAGWVSNAGVSSMAPFLDLSDHDWDFNLSVNAKGAFLCGQVAARCFVEQGGGGVIVNVASMAGKRGNAPFLAHYVASKFAVIGLTQALAGELAPHRILVNAVCPGYVRTGMQERELTWEAALRGLSTEDVERLYVADTPLGRLERAEDVANVVTFLASPAADFITGESININGGSWMD